MTEDYKMITKDWIANTYATGHRGDWQLIYNKYSNSQNIYENYDTNAIVKCYKQVISPKSTGIMWTILVLWSDTLLKGRFVILDENNEIVSIIDKYTSDTDIGCYFCIDLDEKGRLYGIEWVDQERVRFIMLNNIAIPRGTEYYADIRKTYNVPTTAPIQDSSTIGYLVQCVGTAKYGIFIQNSSYKYFYTFEINVDTGNVWKKYRILSDVLGTNPLITYDSDNLFTCYTLVLDTTTNPTIIRYGFIEGQEDIVETQLNVDVTSSYIPINKADIIWNSKDYIIIPCVNSSNNKLIMSRINLSTETEFENVYEEDFFAEQITVKLYTTNGNLFMYVLGTNINQTIGWKECIYHIFDPEFDTLPISATIYEEVLNDVLGTSNTNNLDLFIVQNQYNLYNYLIGKKMTQNGITKMYFDVVQEIYNENNYNGSPWISPISSPLEPKQFILWNKNQETERILYARNIYDKTASGNIVDISLLIPNNLLNDIEINNEQLWGTTKIVMNDEHEVITKNKYEELIITIRNKLNVIDNNNNENILLENISAILNKAMHRITSASQIGLSIQKAKINYEDNTSELIDTTSIKNNDISTISFGIKPSKEVKSIEYISLNNTSFLTITPTLEVGKAYVIRQDVRIGD